MASNGLLCADVPLRNYSLTCSLKVFLFFQQRKAAKDEETAMNDDEIPSDVNIQDPYFAEELSKRESREIGMI